MTVLFHAADLHLSAAPAARDYGLAVWREIVAKAEEHGARVLLLAGDIFDSPADVGQMAPAFLGLLRAFSGHVLYVPGNHEAEGPDLSRWRAVPFAPAVTPGDGPACVWDGTAHGLPLEVVMFPHQAPWRGHAWAAPPKVAGKHRVALAHGIVGEMCFTGPGDDVEDGGGHLPSAFFTGHHFDYVALGHVHGRRSWPADGTLFHYPGSSRVWRRGESGPRCVSKVTLAATVRVEDVPLATAGQFRAWSAAVDAAPGEPGAEVPPALGPADFAHVVLEGFVDEAGDRDAAVLAWQDFLRGKARVTHVSADDVLVLGSHRHHPFVQEFLARWREREPPEGPARASQRAVWLKARQCGLAVIREALEGLS